LSLCSLYVIVLTCTHQLHMFQAGEGNIRPSIKGPKIFICRALASEKKNTTLTAGMSWCVHLYNFNCCHVVVCPPIQLLTSAMFWCVHLYNCKCCHVVVCPLTQL